MQIEYKSRTLERVCTNARIAEKEYGREIAIKIHQRIDQITVSDSVEMLMQFNMGRCHRLKGKRENQYAMDLVHPYRLVFEKRGMEIQIVRIIEIVDYH